MNNNKLRKKLFMIWDFSDGQNISKEFLKKELSSKISAQVFYKVINQVKCFFALLHILDHFFERSPICNQ